MTCRETIAILADYLEAVLTAQAARALEAHLADCPACLAYLNTYRKTRELAATAGHVEMPEEMKARLRAFLLEHLGRP